MSCITWNNENVIKLIEMFREREVLWDTKMDDYKDRLKKHDAWVQIAEGFNLDKQTIEKKMRSIMGQFQRELRKPKADGAPKWFAYKHLLFLKDRNKPEESMDGGLTGFKNQWIPFQGDSFQSDSSTVLEMDMAPEEVMPDKDASNTTEKRRHSFCAEEVSTMCLENKGKKKKNKDGHLERNLAIANYFNKRSEKLQLEMRLLKKQLVYKQTCNHHHHPSDVPGVPMPLGSPVSTCNCNGTVEKQGGTVTKTFRTPQQRKTIAPNGKVTYTGNTKLEEIFHRQSEQIDALLGLTAALVQKMSK